MLQIHIIIEAIFDYRTYPQLNLLGSEQAPNRLRHQVGSTVAHHFEAFRRIQGHDLH
ncbi:hypothetical protein D3C81_2288070 [compost metagenome]